MQEGRWLTEDGTHFWQGTTTNGAAVDGRFTDWSPGEPSGGALENYLMMYSSGLWNDTSCINALAYICKRY